jgi:Na+/H+-translocating membrane pyrophosphatase
LALLTTAGVFGAVAALFVQPVPEANRDALGLALGAVLSAYAGVIGFYFGSSKGARDLVETNRDLSAKLTAPEDRA